jgi:hypothetical protein
MKEYSKLDQKRLAAGAADWAERVVPFFEDQFQGDDRPLQAITTCRRWVRTGVFHMAEIRGASLAAHAAARRAKTGSPAAFAARAAGQAVAAAHVPQHAFGAAYYALKAVVAANPARAGARATIERDWQAGRLSGWLRQDFLSRVLVEQRANRIVIKIRKDANF